jgi:hypothetical protein
MTTPDRAEINRRNAQRSTGPRTAEGKSRSRFNALKHGLTAKTAVLPGEDAAAYQDRVESFVTALEPGNDLEQYLAEQAAQLSWQLDRADRAEAARQAAAIRNAPVEEAFRQEDEVLALGRRLFWDPQGPLALYPHFEYRPGQPRVSSSGLTGDPDDPARLVLRLESTAAGCRWLLDRWAGLRDLLERGLSWQSPDKLKAIRLLGKQPLDAVDDPEVAAIFLASGMLGPEPPSFFAEFKGELLGGELLAYHRRLLDRRIEEQVPADQAEARAVLEGIVGRAVSRLETLAASHRQRAEADAGAQADRLAFDAGVEGERLRRHRKACGRSLLRTIEILLKIRRSADGRQRGADPSEPAGAEDPSSVRETYERIFFGPDGSGDPSDEPPVSTGARAAEPSTGPGSGPGLAEVPAPSTTPTPDPMPRAQEPTGPAVAPAGELATVDVLPGCQNEPNLPRDREAAPTGLDGPEVAPIPSSPPRAPQGEGSGCRREADESSVAIEKGPEPARPCGPMADVEPSSNGSGRDEETMHPHPARLTTVSSASSPTRPIVALDPLASPP